MSQPRWSELERGLGRGATVDTWSIAAQGVGFQLAAFLEAAPGASRPRDMEHLRRQNVLVELAAPGGWRALPELAVDPTPRSRSIDVALLHDRPREAAAAEVWDWFDDVGESLRGLDAKKLLLRDRLEREAPGERPWRVGGLFVVRDTSRNRLLVRELGALFDARFPAASSDWLAALRDPRVEMPTADGFLWGDRTGKLHAWHRRRR